MAVSDLHLVRHLIQATEDERNPLRWRRRGPGEFLARVNGVKLSLSFRQSGEGSVRCLCVSDGPTRTLIEEPPNEAPFASRYRSEEDRLLAESLQLLMERVSGHCAPRRASSWDFRDSIREALFQRILPGKP